MTLTLWNTTSSNWYTRALNTSNGTSIRVVEWSNILDIVKKYPLEVAIATFNVRAKVYKWVGKTWAVKNDSTSINEDLVTAYYLLQARLQVESLFEEFKDGDSKKSYLKIESLTLHNVSWFWVENTIENTVVYPYIIQQYIIPILQSIWSAEHIDDDKKRILSSLCYAIESWITGDVKEDGYDSHVYSDDNDHDTLVQYKRFDFLVAIVDKIRTQFWLGDTIEIFPLEDSLDWRKFEKIPEGAHANDLISLLWFTQDDFVETSRQESLKNAFETRYWGVKIKDLELRIHQWIEGNDILYTQIEELYTRMKKASSINITVALSLVGSIDRQVSARITTKDHCIDRIERYLKDIHKIAALTRANVPAA
jgi:hypothetical protein